MTELAELHVLIVDDEPANVALLKRVLQRAGHANVTGTTDPAEAIAILEQRATDLVLLDLHMPRTDGFEILGRVQALTNSTDYLPILVLTAEVAAEAKERALRAGATDFLTKPFDLTEVVLKVTNLLQMRALHVRLSEDNVALGRELRAREDVERQRNEAREAARLRIDDVLADELFHPVFQPIVELATGRVLGVEALTRFTAEPSRSPDLWFAEAADVGLGFELEVAAVRAVLRERVHVPGDPYVSINMAPATVLDERLATLSDALTAGVTVEITEHAAVADYEALTATLRSLREAGVKLAIDDAGSGFASLRHILRLQPDLIKLDMTITRDIDGDPVRRALAASLVTFAAEIGATLVAEGIESSAEMRVLRDLGVPCGQGYGLARPGPAQAQPEAIDLSAR